MADAPPAFTTAMQHYEAGRLDQALPYFHQALAQEPESVDVLYHAMLTLVAMRQYKDAAHWLQQLLPHVDPTETSPWLMGGLYYNLAISYEASGQWDQAERHHRNALTFDPAAILPKICIGSNQYRQGKPDEGRMWHDRALLPAVVEPESRPARSFLKLLRGDYLGGFAEYESRWKLPQVLAHSYVPTDCWRWKGKPLTGQKILVVGEQGIGDTILMLRYLPLIESLGGKVVLVCNKTLHRLVHQNFPNATVFGFGEKHPTCKWWVPMMSLPFVFQTTTATIPSSDRHYLTADQSALHPIDTVLPRPLVGWVDHGNPLFMGDADRSAPVGAFDPLLNTPGIHFVDLREPADKARGFTDLADTAALIRQLDLVITVDTAIGHLAGALGVPCWLLPMTSLHWLWGLPEGASEHASPWYSRHRLIRRTRWDAWPDVIARVQSDLPMNTVRSLKNS